VGQAMILQLTRDEDTRFRGIYPAQASRAQSFRRCILYRRFYPAHPTEDPLGQLFITLFVSFG
jgi:hypothetical protein